MFAREGNGYNSSLCIMHSAYFPPHSRDRTKRAFMQIVHNYSCSTAAYFPRKIIWTRINVKMSDSCNMLTTWQLMFEVLKCGIFKRKNGTMKPSASNFEGVRE